VENPLRLHSDPDFIIGAIPTHTVSKVDVPINDHSVRNAVHKAATRAGLEKRETTSGWSSGRS